LHPAQIGFVPLRRDKTAGGERLLQTETLAIVSVPIGVISANE
jgi:hypothetical protein